MPRPLFAPEFLFVRRSARAVALATALLTCACASKLPRTPQTFTIDPPTPRPVPPATATRVVSLRRVEVVPAYAGADLVYRVAEHAIESDPYASLAASPAQVLTSAIRGYLRDAAYIRDVVVPGEGVALDAEIEPALMELCGDFTNAAEPAAVISLHFRVLAPASGAAAPREILLKTYTQRVPLAQKTATAVVAAWNRALGEIMGEFLADLKPVLPALGPAK
jgi:ABC-type uncharacterized transport system auxiliary subunit